VLDSFLAEIGGFFTEMVIASIIVGFVSVLVVRKGFSKLAFQWQAAIVVGVLAVVIAVFPAILDNPVGEAVALVTAGRSWASNMGFSFIAFGGGALLGSVFPLGKTKS